MTKGALYRHYKSKRDIFDCIVERMEQGDSEQAASMTCRKMIKRACFHSLLIWMYKHYKVIASLCLHTKMQLKNKKNSLQNKWYSATITTEKTSWR